MSIKTLRAGLCLVSSPDLDESDDVLAEDEGVGRDGAEHKHDAGQQPHRQRCGSLKSFFEI